MNMFRLYIKSFDPTIFLLLFLQGKKYLIMNNVWQDLLFLLIKLKGEQSINPWITNNVTSYLKINKFHSMRETPQLGINYNNMKTTFLIGLIINVIMFITRGQCACCNLITLQHQRLNVEHSSFLSSAVSNLTFTNRLNNEELTDKTTSLSAILVARNNKTNNNNVMADNIICNR